MPLHVGLAVQDLSVSSSSLFCSMNSERFYTLLGLPQIVGCLRDLVGCRLIDDDVCLLLDYLQELAR